MRRLLTIALCIVLLACGCTQAEPGPEPTRTPASLTSFRSDLATSIVQSANSFGEYAANECLQSGFVAYVSSRVIPVEIPDRDPLAFGPWTAMKDYYATDASSDGSLTEWFDNYYITHDWSSIGQQVLDIVPGDTVTVNDRTMRVDGVFNYPKDAYYDEIITLVGEDATVLQTCYPDSDENRIVYGHSV